MKLPVAMLTGIVLLSVRSISSSVAPRRLLFLAHKESHGFILVIRAFDKLDMLFDECVGMLESGSILGRVLNCRCRRC